ncbi:TIGR02206 family membrane protein [Paenibacillus sp. KQZ6P-2]|uniref:TIGR02206 family membrane protein n=1 Tax=Paenibacillus mangrovi TaxID=2931978 RepID=A0A9X2B3D2_9BACL|nr:TIGR02206 family membrane protein [Paenibacillus mangrovi]MCJ8013276.1 TIGR02206 family membrane protein [Paenibacillus mangrovi]
MNEPFVLFSTSHLLALLLLVVASLLLYVFRHSLRHRPLGRSIVRYTLAGLLATSEAVLDIWNIIEGAWSPKYTLPLELCSLTLLLSIIMLLTKNRLLYGILFFAGIGGAFQALITPNLGYAFPHIRFYQFFTAHILIILASLYMTWIENYKPTWRSIGITMIFLNLAALLVGITDHYLGANYMFLMHKPSTASILDFLGPYPVYLLAEEGIALLIFIIMQILFFVLPGKIFRAGKSRSHSAI